MAVGKEEINHLYLQQHVCLHGKSSQIFKTLLDLLKDLYKIA